jgi:hypothetical protein
MPDPLLGFALQSIIPRVQPYAVSSASYPLAVGPPGLLYDLTSILVAKSEDPRQLL